MGRSRVMTGARLREHEAYVSFAGHAGGCVKCQAAISWFNARVSMTPMEGHALLREEYVKLACEAGATLLRAAHAASAKAKQAAKRNAASRERSATLSSYGLRRCRGGGWE